MTIASIGAFILSEYHEGIRAQSNDWARMRFICLICVRRSYFLVISMVVDWLMSVMAKGMVSVAVRLS